MVNCSDPDPTLTETQIPWLLRVFPDNRQQGYRLAELILRERNLSRIVVLRSNSRPGRVGVRPFVDAVRRLGRPILQEINFKEGDHTFTTQIAVVKQADPDAVVAYYRVHFKPALARSEDYEKLILRMQARFIEQGKEGILKSRAVEERLVNQTWASPNGYDLHPKLKGLNIPALVITGDHDFFPFAAEHIAQAIPSARLVTLKDCGHFPYLECPAPLREQIDAFFRSR